MQQQRLTQIFNPGGSFRWLNGVRFLALGIIPAVLTTIPATAAEKIDFTFGPIKQSLQVRSLEEYSQTGVINQELGSYFELTKADDQIKAEFREALLKRVDIDDTRLRHLLKSDIGGEILTRFGEFIQVQGGGNGRTALQTALLQATADANGLTLLNVLREFPTDIEIDVQLALELSQEAKRVVEATEKFTAETATLSTEEANTEINLDYPAMPDLRQTGAFQIQTQQWRLNTQSPAGQTQVKDDRQFYVNVYRPQTWRSGKTPVVIISHGFSSSPEDFAPQAQHLASYGYVVALPQHPGSDAAQTQKFWQGSSPDLFVTHEFLNRPQVISTVIDELERRNQSDFGGRLDLQSVGVLGHSFGGYTALAIAGAKIDFVNLEKDCQRQFGYLNTSLLLQCRALKLPRQDYDFRDRRVKAVIATNPVNSSIFGPQGLSQIQIPVILGAGSYDPATPVVFEQARSFSWLTTDTKYLALSEGQAHVNLSQLDAGITEILDSIPGLTLPSQNLLDSYSNPIVLAFFETHLQSNSDYSPYLQASYANHLSQGQRFKLHLISADSASKFNQVIESVIPQDEGSSPAHSK